ncbi:MAG: hypothetical protein HY342_02480 [Candidatus Lambdaproteobacteria bacterium]|nr:hypothetical protein [Candidatus Lambdaproteobacteria bacterium]
MIPLRHRGLLPGLLAGVLACAAWAAPALAEYRAYELEVIDKVECKLNERKTCERFRLNTAMAPDTYARMHGGNVRIGVQLMATWMCYGDTSYYKPVCPRPPARKPRFNAGDTVKIALKKHITEGWSGTVELTYYQASLGANVYGVRFSDRQNVYARYFEKDLVKPAPQREPPQ